MEVPRSDRRPAPRGLVAIAVTLAALTGLAIVALDQPIARWLARWEPSPVWDRGLPVVEWLIGLPISPLVSAAAVVAGMVATVVVPRWRGYAPAWMFVAGTHLVSRLAMRELKDLTGRLRPTEWLERGGDTFWRDGGISFPSGHVVLFASLAIPVIVLWPRARWLAAALLAIVMFVAAARVVPNAHFVSDATGALTLVALVASAVGFLVRPIRR